MAYVPVVSAETISDIQRRPLLAAAERHISMGDDCADLSIDQLCSIYPSWIKEDMLLGVNSLLRAAEEQDTYVYPLWPGEAGDKHHVSLVHFAVPGQAPFVLLCAGGAYCSVASMVEAFPIAARLNEMGYHAFVLEYRCGGEGRYPEPMEDLARAIRFIQRNAEKLHVKREHYAACGMSAGGHLVATLGAKSMQDIYAGIPKPAAIFLGYPVITMGEYTHPLSRQTLLGRHAAEEAVERLSIEKQIYEHTPPVYLWQCANDDVVPVENSKLLRDALKHQGIPCRYRLYPGTAHGWALGSGTPAEGWLAEAVQFWQAQK